MPLFADLAAMQERFEAEDLLELTDQAQAGTIDAARIDKALDKADAIITGYVAARHADVPSLAGHPILTEVACDLAFADLWRSDQPEFVKTRRKEALAMLEGVAKGTIKLDEGTEVAKPRPDGSVMISGPVRRMGRDNLAGY